ncbi:MAG: class I SAM-dependent methyltransferase [Magnetococcales bacterium]|nr:class I SAM-dependent methyltransferase [Magnetococcales bacterium]
MRLRLPFLKTGYRMPEPRVACELGFGQGVSTAIHTAAAPLDWWATDFNPSHVAHGQELIASFQGGAHLFDQSFDEFCHRNDLPEFDFIGLHGVWSWVSDDNHRTIVDFVRRKLKVGGVLYISYNTQPGWAARIPLRHIIDEHFKRLTRSGTNLLDRIDDAFAFAARLLEQNPAYMVANPRVAEQFHWIRTANRHYLAHELFNQAWRSYSFSEISDWLSAAKVTFVGSANPLDHVAFPHLNEGQRVFLDAIPDPTYRETVRDFMINQQFRQDYWVKGPQRLDQPARNTRLRDQRVVLMIPRAQISLKIQGAQGETPLDPELYNPLLDLLADHQPLSIGELERKLTSRGVTLDRLLESLLVLNANSGISLIQEEPLIQQAKPRCAILNRHLLEQARHSDRINHLASPVTGGGVRVPRLEQLFLLSASQGADTPREWADQASQWLDVPAEGPSAQDRDEPAETQKTERFERAQRFVDTLTILRSLGIG